MADPAPVVTTRRATNPATGIPLSALEIMQASCLESVILLPSASRTVTESSVAQHNIANRGVIVDLTVTTPGIGSVTASIERWNPAASAWVVMLTGTAVTTATTASLTLFPAATVTANVSANASLPRMWRVTVTHNNANAITYSVGISTLN